MTLTFREITKDDISIINQWRNNKELSSKLVGPYRYVNSETDTNWFDNYLQDRNNAVRLAIVLNRKVIGTVGLVNIDYVVRKAEILIMISDTYNQNKGYGYLAMQEMLSHAFNDLNLNRIELVVLSYNKTAQGLYKKCGFQQEGRLRDYCYKAGEYKDVYMMSILRNEYRAMNAIKVG